MNHPRSGFAAPPQGGGAGGPAKPDPRRLLDKAPVHISTVVIAAALVLSLAPAAQAQQHRGQPGAHGAPGAHLQLDERYHHDHYYPARGYALHALPGGSVSVPWHGSNYYFHGGVWWRPYGSRFVVVLPPIGIVVPLLPSAYVSLWIGGAPYYYANGAYYAPLPGQGYTVVAPPPGAESAVPAPVATPAKPPPEPIIYPRNGQTAAQTEADRQECNRWATTQPTALGDREVFQRAVAACMDGRGYTVR